MNTSIKNHLKDILWNAENSEASVEAATMVQLIPSLATGFLQDTANILETYLVLEESLLIKRITNYEITEIRTDTYTLPDTIVSRALSYLKTLYQLCSTSENGLPKSPLWIELQKTLLVCHSSRNPEIAKFASRCMGMIVKISAKLDPSLLDLWWECILSCLNNPDSAVDPENGYVLWLRCISSDIMADSFDALQQFFATEEYWTYLQDGILNKSYEIRKYTLYILAQSLQKVQTDINLPSMRWEMKRKDEYTWEWQRYTTLVNIISIDTSLHQAEDSSADLIKIIGAKSLVPKSWARCLLSAGLLSSMESLRKFIGNVTMQLTSEDMGIFATGFSFMTDILLPYLMSAHHFATEKSKSTPSFDICPFGERLADFISSLFHYLDDSTSKQACHYFLSLLYKQRRSFDPARLYIMYGIERGLCNRKVLSIEDLELIKSLFEFSTETKLREKAIYYLYYRLMLSCSDDSVPFRTWFSILVDISSIRSYLYLNAADQLVEYIASSSYRDEFQGFGDVITDEGLYNCVPVYLDLKIRMGVPVDRSIFSKMSFNQLLELSFSDIPSVIELLQGHESQQIINNDMSNLVNDTLDVNTEKTDSALVLKVSKSYSELRPKQKKKMFKFADYIPNYNKYVNSLWTHVHSIKLIDETRLEYIYSQLSMVNIVLEQAEKAYSGPPAIPHSQILEFLDRLIRTKTQTKELTTVKNNALVEAYRVLYNMSDFESDCVEEMFDGFNSQVGAISYQSRHYMCLTVEAAIHSSDDFLSTYGEYVNLFVMAFWSALVTDRLIATERDLHVAFINMAFSEPVLHAATDSSSLAETLEEISGELIQQSYARRCLLPQFSQNLYTFQSSHPDYFAEWIGRTLVSIYSFIQIDDHLFRLEHILATRHDSLVKERQDLPVTPTTYTDEYGRNESSSRIDVVFTLASLKPDQPPAIKIAQYLFDIILTSPKYHIFEPIKRMDSHEETERTLLYQILLILSRFIEQDLEAMEHLINDVFIAALYTEPSPVVRTYVEWLISRFSLILLQSEKPSILFEKLDNLEETPRVAASYLRMCLMISRRLKTNKYKNWAQYYHDYISKVIPFSSSNRAAVRHFAVSMLCAVSDEFNEEKDVPESLEDLIAVVHGIAIQAKSSDTYKQYRSGESSIWDIEQDYSLVGICGGVLRKTSDRALGEIDEHEFLIYRPLSEPEIKVGLGSDFARWEANDEANGGKSRKDLRSQTSESLPLQVKSTSWNSVIDMTAGEDGRDSDKVKRGELIVVSSLVDKPPNLGGICRLCDVLGVKELCLNDMSVTRSPQFKNVAVTAERWMPMTEVKEANIIDFMMEKKREGYTLIGLEQTDKSVELNADLKFPRKSLVLLGKEREGIPGEYLAELDFCVEIKQVGVIRSMNIQTATAVLVHSYSIQHC